MHVLGIDAGGTKTVCLLADDRGAILSEGRGGGANLQVNGELELEKVLYEVMEQAIGDRAWRADAICLGIAGADRDDDARTVRAILRRISPGSRLLVVNDALIALEAGAPGAPGIVIIAGTGSIVYGRNPRRMAARAGGWGHMIGDEGSGYWIGREALAAVVREVDGRGPKTGLTEAVLEHFSVADATGLVHIVYNREVPRQHVAALGPIVQTAASAGDAVACHILERAAEELVLAASSVAARLEMRGDPFPFVLAGGIFRVVPWLVAELGRRLLEVAPRCQVQPLTDEPAIGAVSLATAEARGGAAIPAYL
jgi:N-acetylglucosamine kinase-like BadF-type ATPase